MHTLTLRSCEGEPTGYHILDNSGFPAFCRGLGRSFVLFHEEKVRPRQKLFAEFVVEVLERPAQRPELNPIQHENWDLLDR